MLGDYAKSKVHITSLGGFCEDEIDKENCSLRYFFATADQINLKTRFLDVVGLGGDLQNFYLSVNANNLIAQIIRMILSICLT